MRRWMRTPPEDHIRDSGDSQAIIRTMRGEGAVHAGGFFISPRAARAPFKAVLYRGATSWVSSTADYGKCDRPADRSAKSVMHSVTFLVPSSPYVRWHS